MPTHADVEERLDRVTDPELDRSIVRLQYVDAVDIDGSAVAVRFKLPTAWCSPAFAWMMATGIRDEVGSLRDVETVSVELLDHLHADEINRGVNREATFASSFPDANGEVEQVRRELDEKARIARQFGALEALLDAGADPDWIARLERGAVEFAGELATIRSEGESLSVAADPLKEYLQKATTVDVAVDDADRLFLTPERTPIPVTEFETVRRRCRLAQTNMRSQGSVCEGLQVARYGSEVLAE